MPLFIAKVEAPDAETLVFEGAIDEHAALVLEAIEISQERVLLDLHKVSYVNSIGVRAWLVWIAKVTKGASVSFHQCSPVVVSQIYMLGDFLGQGQLVSIYAPVVCPRCSKQGEVFLERPLVPEYERLAGVCACGIAREWEEPINDLLNAIGFFTEKS